MRRWVSSASPERALDFYEGLAADNSKAYWSDHKVVYDDQIRAPMLALLADLEPEFGSEVLPECTCMDRVREGWRATQPLVDWLAKHVGAAEPPH